MKVWVLYKEEELDFNQSYLDDVELFDNEEPALQAAYWLNERLDDYDRKYCGWSVSERLVRMRDMESPQQESQKGVSFTEAKEFLDEQARLAGLDMESPH